MRNNLTILKINGIPIRVNFTWFISFALFTFILYQYYSVAYEQWDGLQVTFISAASVLLLFLFVLIHELAHSITAQLQGIKVTDITLFLLGGVSNIKDEAKSARNEFFITIAGPATNVVLFGIFFGVQLWGIADGNESIAALITYATGVNVILAIFNMLPGIPLDGGRVLSSLVWSITRKKRKPYIATSVAATTGQVLGGLLILIGILPLFGNLLLIPLLETIGADGVVNFLENWLLNRNLLFNVIWFALMGFFLISASSAEKRHAKILEKQRELWDEHQ